MFDVQIGREGLTSVFGYLRRTPSAGLLASCLAGSLVTLVVGWLLFRRLEPAVLKEL